jgi:hypothetical protein
VDVDAELVGFVVGEVGDLIHHQGEEVGDRVVVELQDDGV